MSAIIYPISFEREDTCIKCKSKKSIECYDTRNNPIGFSRVLDLLENNKNVSLNNREFSHMVCRNCGTKFNLHWINGGSIPRPLYNTDKINTFINKYY